MKNLTEITIDQAINHNRKEYNARIWKETINRYAKYDAKFYESDEISYGSTSVYAIYYVDGFRVIQEVSYCVSLTSYPMQSYYLHDNQYLNKAPYKFEKTPAGRKLAGMFTQQETNLMVGDLTGI